MTDYLMFQNKFLTLMGGSKKPNYLYHKYLQGFVESGKLILWYKLNETSGTTVINYGSAGVGLNATMTGADVGQTGQLGTNEAYDFVDAGDKIVIANNAAWKDVSTFEWHFLINPDNEGSSSLGRILEASTSYRVYFETTMRLTLNIPCVTTNATTATVANSLVATTFQHIRISYDHAGDKKIRVYKNSVECTYNTQTAGDGNFVPSVADMYLFNNLAANRAFVGLGDEVLFFNDIDDIRSANLTNFFGF